MHYPLTIKTLFRNKTRPFQRATYMYEKYKRASQKCSRVVKKYQLSIAAIISSGAQTLHALRVLRGHGMGDDALQRVFQSVIVAKLQYASSAWWGFSNVKERKRIEAFI